MVVDSPEPIVVERSLFWPVGAWHESHSSAAMPAPQLKWGLAEGQVGGPTRAQTYILSGTVAAARPIFTVTFLRTTADRGQVVHGRAERPANIAVTAPTARCQSSSTRPLRTIIQSTQPIVVERSVYVDVGGATGRRVQRHRGSSRCRSRRARCRSQAGPASLS